MINAYFGVKETPFNTRKPILLEQQQRAFDIILSQCQMHVAVEGLTQLFFYVSPPRADPYVRNYRIRLLP